MEGNEHDRRCSELELRQSPGRRRQHFGLWYQYLGDIVVFALEQLILIVSLKGMRLYSGG
jgi:hypothetical protein